MIVTLLDIILAQSPSGYTARAITSTSGSTHAAPLALIPNGPLLGDLSLSEVFAADVVLSWNASPFAQALRQLQEGYPNRETVNTVGNGLYAALPDNVHELYHLVWGRVRADTDMTLRVRLRFDAPELGLLPWEYLKVGDSFLVEHPRRSLIRYPETNDLVVPFRAAHPLRVLLWVADSRGTEPLAAEQEVAQIKQALTTALGDQVQFTVVREGGPRELLVRLREGYHILHYIGHGKFEGEGLLAFVPTATGDPIWIEADRLVPGLIDNQSLQLVFLNSCNTGLGSATNAYASLGFNLARFVPAVLAMQYPILDSSALTFSQEFYRAFACGVPLEACVTQGRQALIAELGERTIDWGIPALFTRADVAQSPITTTVVDRPHGEVTILFTNIEGSTQLWERQPETMRSVLLRYDYLLRLTIERAGGYIFNNVGDAFYTAFSTANSAIFAALTAQRAIRDESWGDLGPLHVRMAINTGLVQEQDEDYFGSPVNRGAQLLAAGWGGQILISSAVEALVRDSLSEGTTLRSLGEHRLKDLTIPEHIYQIIAPDLPAEFPPLKTLDVARTNLPVLLTTFIGREAEAMLLGKLLRQDRMRLVTCVGAGGSGKTRLALHVAADLLDEYEDGVWFVQLAPISDPALVMTTVADTLNVREVRGQTRLQTLKDALHDKHQLLILDNFEQVVEAAELVIDLLTSVSRLKILITSREPLNVTAEYEFRVPPLTIPDIKHLLSVKQLAHVDAVRLFTERAAAHDPSFAITSANARAIAEICIQLDGLPLAIELAAVHVRALSPQEILAQLSSRLEFLLGGPRDLPARQQTIRATIDWSYTRLHAPEQRLFRRMAVFQGNRALEALTNVCNSQGDLGGNPLVLVEALVSKNLVQKRESEKGLTSFWLFQTIHEYANDQLSKSGEAAALQRRHAKYYSVLAERAGDQLRGEQQSVWLSRLDFERENLRTALKWASKHNKKMALSLAAALWRFWYIRGEWTEGLGWLTSALENSPSVSSIVRANAYHGAGGLAYGQGDLAAARRYWEESRQLNLELGNSAGLAAALQNLGLVAHSEGAYSEASALIKEYLELQRTLEDNWGIAAALTNLGLVSLAQCDYSGAQSLLEESLEKFRVIGDDERMALALINLGLAALALDKTTDARHFLEEGLSRAQAAGSVTNLAQAFIYLGRLGLKEGAMIQAQKLYSMSAALLKDSNDKQLLAECLEGFAEVAVAQKQAEIAARLFSAASSLRAVADIPMTPVDYTYYMDYFSAAQGLLTEDAWASAWAAGQKLTSQEALSLALDEV